MYPSLILLLNSNLQNSTESIFDNVLTFDRWFFITVWPQCVFKDIFPLSFRMGIETERTRKKLVEVDLLHYFFALKNQKFLCSNSFEKEKKG